MAMMSGFTAAYVWTGHHKFAAFFIVAVPVAAVRIVWDANDWLSVVLGVGAGLCWSGVLLPTVIRELAVLLAGAMTAMSGALLSIVLSHAIESPPVPGSDVAPVLFSTIVAGTAALYGQHRNGAEQRAASRELVEVVQRIAARQESDTQDLTTMIRTLAVAYPPRRVSLVTRLVTIWRGRLG